MKKYKNLKEFYPYYLSEHEHKTTKLFHFIGTSFSIMFFVFFVIELNPIYILYAILSICAVALGSGAAGSLNCWYEADVDKVMSRTCLRPIPTGKLTKNEALIFGILSSFVSVGALYFFSNFIAAALLALTILFYVFVYTIWLKRKTPQNIVIGGAAGALPPVIGWAIATGGISIEPIILFLIIFVWTPSHFWALSLFKSEDYKKANIPMLPVTSGVETTKKNIFAYSILLFPVAVAPYYLEFLGIIYLLFSFPLSTYYIFICYKLLKTKDKKSEKSISKQIFAFSILYLFAIFISILVDKFA